jgi:Bacterial archaeo-eukaryotic release factor family 7
MWIMFTRRKKMDILTRAELEQLMHEEQQWCVSIYMPTHRTGPETQQDPIRLKNLLGEAERLLSARSVGTRDVRKMLEPANKLLHEPYFWQHQSDGLAIFLSSNRVRRYRLPLNLEESVVVTDHFHIKPLLPLFTGDGQFYILALSQNEVRLLNGTRYSISEVDIGQVAGSLADALPPDGHQASLQIHTSGSAGGETGDGSVTFHGQGGGSDESAKNDLLRYFHLVADGLMEFLQGEQVPLMLAGVEYLLPIYKEANTYPNLIDMVIKGNPDLLSADELHKSAWDIIGPLFQAAQEEAVAHYQQLAGQASERVADTLEKIVPFAYHGRVETLFVASGVQQWGVFNPVTDEIELHDPIESGDAPLLDLAAVQTYLKGGIVYAVEPEKVPGGTSAAAVLRY